MGFPDRIERVIDLNHSQEEVWAAITTAQGLAGWFGEQATIVLQPGGDAHMSWADGFAADMRIERVEPRSVFGFTWPVFGMPKDDPRRTYVEFTLEANGSDTRLRVVETGFAQLPGDAYTKGFNAHTEGWVIELDELVQYLDGD